MERDRGSWTDSLGTGKSLGLLLLAVLCITVPFAGKAFHLDDTILIRLAQEQLRDPLSLGLPDYGFGGDFFARYHDTHPPLVAVLLALLIRVFGGASETGLHLAFIAFPALGAGSMFFLGRRFTRHPLTASLLLVVTPGFMVMSQSVMTDVPSLSLWLAAIAAYVFGADRDDFRLLVLAGAFMALAMLTTYQSFSLIPLLLLYAILARRIRLRTLLPLAAALAAFAGVFAFYYLVTGGPPKLSYSIGVSMEPSFVANKVLSAVSVLGGAIVFPAMLAVGLLKGRKEYLYLALVLAALLALFLLRGPSGQYTVVSAVLQAVFYAGGILVVYRLVNTGIDAVLSGSLGSKPQSEPGEERKVRVAKTGERRTHADTAGDTKDGDTIFLVLWFLGVLTYCILLLPYASTRYLLPFFPPVILLFLRFAESIFPARSAWTRFAVAAVALTALAGLAAAVADFQLSGVYRDFARSEAQSLQAGGRRLWFAGEFGLRYYLEEQGARYLTRTEDTPAPGDHVILSHDLIAYYLSSELKQRLVLERSVPFPTSWPVRDEDRGSRAGFYDQFHGNLPWSLSASPIETIDIYVVR